jgi:OOP family OmpA-OmpF porin
VRQYVVNAGIGAERVSARGYGESNPVASNKTSAGRAGNRRIEFHKLN